MLSGKPLKITATEHSSWLQDKTIIKTNKQTDSETQHASRAHFRQKQASVMVLCITAHVYRVHTCTYRVFIADVIQRSSENTPVPSFYEMCCWHQSIKLYWKKIIKN